MNLDRHTQFLMRKEKILSVAEKLLLENNQEITLDELVAELDIAKGTLYKHFRSKNELLLELIIQNEKQILEISQKYNTDFKEYAHGTCSTICSHREKRFYCINLKKI